MAGHQMGHYVSYSLRDGQWYLFNDEVVKKVDWSEVEQREAYILFYVR